MSSARPKSASASSAARAIGVEEDLALQAVQARRRRSAGPSVGWRQRARLDRPEGSGVLARRALSRPRGPRGPPGAPTPFPVAGGRREALCDLGQSRLGTLPGVDPCEAVVDAADSAARAGSPEPSASAITSAARSRCARQSRRSSCTWASKKRANARLNGCRRACAPVSHPHGHGRAPGRDGRGTRGSSAAKPS